MQKQDFSLYTERRKKLLHLVKEKHSQAGAIVLFASFERETAVFRQESSFYYFTGITEPGLVAVIDTKGASTLFVPNCGKEREKWIFSPVSLNPSNAHNLGFDAIKNLGSQCAGYQFHPFFPQAEYEDLLKFFAGMGREEKIFTLAPQTPYQYIDQRLILERLKNFLPGIEKSIVDISPLVAKLRRKKDQKEIELMYKAVEITALAQEVAARTIEDQLLECEVQASFEYMFTGSGARAAFPSIVATGKNATILHYTMNNAQLKKGDLVIVDIGAEYEYYAADITRTYPVSGFFSKRQREIYDLVLETQEYIAALAKPGMWLSNKDEQEKSLNHLAKKYLDERGYGNYFPHGIGHFLGLDVHDVGDAKQPLEAGDVITIEPGIYIPQESLGVRIEDDFWIVEDGAMCLSEYIPKQAKEIEQMMKEKELN